jgi:hypothetical protein
MAEKEIRVYPREGIWGSGYVCDHYRADPQKAGEVALCEKCRDAVDNGAKIVKMKEE